MLGSMPRSNRNEASVLNPCLLAVFRILTGSKYADSRKMFVVVVLIPEFKPPKTPAIHMGCFELQITKSSWCSLRSTLSKVVNFSFLCAVRTITFLSVILSASKACSGCPKPCNTKLVISTMLLIGTKPIAFSLF